MFVWYQAGKSGNSSKTRQLMSGKESGAGWLGGWTNGKVKRHAGYHSNICASGEPGEGTVKHTASSNSISLLDPLLQALLKANDSHLSHCQAYARDFDLYLTSEICREYHSFNCKVRKPLGHSLRVRTRTSSLSG